MKWSPESANATAGAKKHPSTFDSPSFKGEWHGKLSGICKNRCWFPAWGIGASEYQPISCVMSQIQRRKMNGSIDPPELDYASALYIVGREAMARGAPNPP